MYELLALELDPIKPPGCTRTKGGWEGGGSLSRPSRHRLDLVQAAPTICTVSPSAVSREAGRFSVALDTIFYVVTYQVPGI